MAGNYYEAVLNKDADGILEKIKSFEVILNQFFKDDVSFSIIDDVVYLGHHFTKEMDVIIAESTEFFQKYSKPNDKKRQPKHYDPILWWYRFGIAKDCFLKKTQLSKEEKGELIRFRGSMRAKYYQHPRKRTKDGHINIYHFTDNELFKRRLFESVGLVWDREEELWDIYYNLLCRYYHEMGHTYVPSHKSIDGYDLGSWVTKIIKNKNSLTPNQIQQLEAVEFPYRHLVIAGTSFWEQALFYYIKQWYSDAENRKKKFGRELDIRIPGPPEIAIEYDGYYSHKNEEDYQNDMDKDQFCIENKIEIVRVREHGLKPTPKAKCFFLSKRDFTFEEFDEVAREVLKYVCHTDMLAIDTSKFGDEILRQYCHLESLANYKNMRKLVDYYNLHLEWPTKSGDYELWKLMCLFRNAKKGKYIGLVSKTWLEELGRYNFPFDPYDERFEKFMAHLQRYYEEEGDVNQMRHDFVDYYDGTPYHLGSQLVHIKWRHPDNIKGYGTKKGRELTPEQVNRLNVYQLDWRTNRKV